MSKKSIEGGSGKTLDPRKKTAAPAGESKWNPTMISGGKSKASEGKTLDPRKKTAKPSGESKWNPTMI